MKSHPRATSLAISLILLVNSIALAPAPQAPAPDVRFGAVEAWMAPDRAAELRVGWDRLIMPWYVRQPDGADQWSVPGEETDQVNTALAAGREVVGLLMGTPAWATDGPPLGGVPRGLYLPVEDPGNLWAAFVRRMVGEYAGRINHWIIWNEPDIAPGDPGVQWEGSVEDYYQLLKVAYIVAKQANPKAVIHLAGVTHWHDVVHNRAPFLQRLLDVAKLDPTARKNKYYFDVVTLHIYFRTETVPYIINTYRAILRKYGLSTKAVWVNETNAAPYDDPQYPWIGPLVPVTMDQQAAFIIQSFALALASGAERVAVYKLIDAIPPIPGGDSYGLYRNDGSARPAVEAFRLVTSYLGGVRKVIFATDPEWYIVRLERGTQGVTRVAWARTAQATEVHLRATAGAVSVHVYDHLGNEYPVQRDKKGNILLTLPGAVCPADCAVGGTTFVVVESFGG